MCKHLSRILPFCLLAALLSASVVRSQPAAKQVFTGPPAPEELKVLAPFVGQWNTEGSITPSIRHKEGFTSKGETSCQWIHNGHFLRLDGFGVSTQGRFESTTIISFNRASGQFRQFAFTTDGIASEGVREWDDETKTLTMKGLNLPAGWTAVGKITLQKDRLVQSVLVKNDKGEVVRDVISTSDRKK
jgi:hypothetical protein